MAARTNPKGGGGDQFHHIFTQRQGEYGVHNTVMGKIVYQRPRHYWNSADLMRILPKVAEEVDRNPPEREENWTWWEKAINYLADWMLSKIVSFANLSEGFAPVVWSWIMKTWQAFLVKLMPNDWRVAEVARKYDQRMRWAIEDYMRTGDGSLLETLLEDISSVKE
jgi:hypothetical protein